MPVTRRTFLQITGLEITGMATAAAAPWSRAAFAASTSREPLCQLPYSAVQLTGGPLGDHYDAIHAHYLSLSNNRLLKVYRQNAGLPAPGEDMGGWYNFDGFVPGHSLGQYISGLSRLGACTGDTACTQKAQDLVAGFAETLGPQNHSILRHSTNLWICYTLDKHFAGLIDAATLAHDDNATALLSMVLAGAAPLLPAQGRDRIGKKNPPYDETFVMPENLFLAADLTGNPRFHDLALRYMLDRELFDPLARGQDPFPGQHAYSHAIALSSAGQAWLTLGDNRYLQAMRNAFTLLTTTQQFASGGWGPNETFITPHRGELFASLSTTVDHFETPCGAYAATKLARFLLRTSTPSSTEHADNLERVLFNTILVVHPPDSDGDYPYYSSYSAAAAKTFYPVKWPCCSGTLVQTVADYPLNIYFTSHDGLYVALYTPSRATFQYHGTPVHIEQDHQFPVQDTVTLTLQLEQPQLFTLYLRLPGWLAGTPALRLNGKPFPLSSGSGSFASVRRQWHNGDRLDLNLPQDFRMEPIDDLHTETVALLRGPVQYVALDGSNRSSSPRRIAPGSLKQSGPQTFVENVEGQQVVFIPLYAVGNERYTSYFDKA